MNRAFNLSLCSIILLLFSCSRTCEEPHLTSLLTSEEKSDLEVFFNSLLFENHGAYVLFGSKPMCQALLLPDFALDEIAKLNSEIPHEVLKTGQFIETVFTDQWKTWEKVKTRFPMDRFLIAIRSLPYNPASQAIFLIDISKSTQVLMNHWYFFSELLGCSFDPTDLIREIENPKSEAWATILSNHIAMGLLFGYGEENAREFEKHMALHHMSFVSVISDDREMNVSHFDIPQFASLPNHRQVSDYMEEREHIQEVYKNCDMLEATLRKLISRGSR